MTTEKTRIRNSWDAQSCQNQLALMESPDYAARRRVIKMIAQALNNSGIKWTLTCSAALFLHGIVKEFGDLDILVRVEDFETLKNVLVDCGVNMEPTEQKESFGSPYYQQASITVDGEKVDFDLIAMFWPRTFGTEYCYDLQETHIEWVDMDTVDRPSLIDEMNMDIKKLKSCYAQRIKVPILAVEVQLILYWMMEGWQAKRRLKRMLCVSYLEDNGIKHRGYLTEIANDAKMPDFVRNGVRELLAY